MDGAAASLAEAVARRSYGRLVAYLVGRTRDLAAAEDALAEAFRAALETWPRDGVPRSPEAWLLTVARRAHGARERAAMRAAAAAPEIARAIDEAGARAAEEADMRFPDHRLKLLFVCAHPAIDPGGAHAADAADGARARRRADCGRVPGAARHHEPAAGPGEGQDQGGAHPLRHARAARPARAARRRCARRSSAPMAPAGTRSAPPTRAAATSPRRRCSSPGRWSS